jgi:ubiquinone/menaquinone biosynthesis C-methylase UbiE
MAFRPGKVDYEEQAPNYSRARALTAAAEDAWREAATRWLSALQPALVLDLGCGTGRFSPLLAEWFGCRVIGVEPSEGMRESARVESAHPRVEYTAGDAGSIPLEDGYCDAAWLGYMIHHVPDRMQCARELMRVIKPGGVVLVSGAYTERRREISLFKYFPAALRIVDAFPLAQQITADFAAGGLEHVADDGVRIESVGSLREAAVRLAKRADTTLRLITDEEFAEGLRALEEAAARETEPQPVIDTIDLLVYRRP